MSLHNASALLLVLYFFAGLSSFASPDDDSAQSKLIKSASKQLFDLNKEIIEKLGGEKNFDGKIVLMKAKVLQDKENIKVDIIDVSIMSDSGKPEPYEHEQNGTLLLKGRIKSVGDGKFSLDMKDIMPGVD